MPANPNCPPIPYPYSNYQNSVIKAKNKTFSKVKAAVDKVYVQPAHKSALLAAGTAAMVTAAVVAVVVGAATITVSATLLGVIALLALPVVTILLVVAICAILMELI